MASGATDASSFSSLAGLGGGAANKWQKAARKVQAVNRVTAKTKMWLDALHDNLTSLRTISSLFCLGNVLGDGDFRLVVAGLDRRLRVFQGATVSSDSTLVDLPSSIAIFTPPGGRGHTPRSHVAVAIGPSLFIYDHLRPIHRYTLPTLPVSDEERRIWSALEEGEESGNGTEGGGGAPAANMDGPSSSPSPSSPTTTITGFDHAVAKLAHLQEMGHVVCPRSMRLLALESPEAQHNFVLMTMGAALEHPTSTITAVHAVCSTSPSNPETQLVVGTENGRLLLLDALATRAEAILQIGHAAVVTMGSTGALGEVGSSSSSSSSSCTCRVAVLTRNARVHVVGGRLAKVTATMALSAPGVALTCHLDFVVIACMDESIQCFGLDGARRFSVFTGSPILALASMPAAQASVHLPMGQLSEVGCVVACADSSLRVYRKSQLVSKVMLPCPAQAMVYGRFGREDAALVLALANGALHVKFLPRANALFNGSVYTHDTSHQALEIPKKTKVFVELTQRERESAVEMHRLFQRDLTKLRLKAAKTFIQLLTDGQGHVSYGKGANLRMNTTVMGLGPTFCVQLSLQNTGEDMIADLILVVLANKARYRVEPGMMPIPVLCPGALHPFEVKCVALTLDAPPEDVQVLVLREGHPTPLLAVAAKMPASEPWDEE